MDRSDLDAASARLASWQQQLEAAEARASRETVASLRAMVEDERRAVQEMRAALQGKKVGGSNLALTVWVSVAAAVEVASVAYILLAFLLANRHHGSAGVIVSLAGALGAFVVLLVAGPKLWHGIGGGEPTVRSLLILPDVGEGVAISLNEFHDSGATEVGTYNTFEEFLVVRSLQSGLALQRLQVEIAAEDFGSYGHRFDLLGVVGDSLWCGSVSASLHVRDAATLATVETCHALRARHGLEEPFAGWAEADATMQPDGTVELLTLSGRRVAVQQAGPATPAGRVKEPAFLRAEGAVGGLCHSSRFEPALPDGSFLVQHTPNMDDRTQRLSRVAGRDVAWTVDFGVVCDQVRPAVGGDRVVVAVDPLEGRQMLVCIAVDSGEVLWRQRA